MLVWELPEKGPYQAHLRCFAPKEQTTSKEDLCTAIDLDKKSHFGTTFLCLARVLRHLLPHYAQKSIKEYR